MPKEPTEKQLAARKKFAEQSRARAAERKAKKENEETTQPISPADVVPAPIEARDPGAPEEPTVTQLQQQIMELKSIMFDNMKPQASEKVGTGTKERYPVDPTMYPDPSERLASEERLQPVAFKFNYELLYQCNPTRRYETQDHEWFVEPQFTLELSRIVLDPDTGQATNRRYTICRGIFFEDPDTAIQMALDLGLPVDRDNEKDFLDEMRYLRMRDWLFDAFFKPLDTSPKKNKRPVVIDGREVDMWEVSGEDNQNIPFDQLKNKLKV